MLNDRNLLVGIVGAVTLVLLAVVGAFIIIGPERIWNLFGPPDLGAISFETLKRRSTPNDALACPTDLCSAKSDIIPPLFSVSASELQCAFGNVIASEERVTKVEAADRDRTERYIQRSRLMGFPDTIVVQFFERPGGRSTLALYSRSQMGKSDFGVNRARIARWLEKLTTQAPVSN
jgi:uncharacterized protein (DUF1499 family)